mgnify:CR=1 FL=1
MVWHREQIVNYTHFLHAIQEKKVLKNQYVFKFLDYASRTKNANSGKNMLAFLFVFTKVAELLAENDHNVTKMYNSRTVLYILLKRLQLFRL